METYKVKYKVNHTNSQMTMKLHGGSESEAIASLKQKQSIPKNAEVIILSIEKV